jgi:hypothetical protein
MTRSVINERLHCAITRSAAGGDPSRRWRSLSACSPTMRSSLTPFPRAKSPLLGDSLTARLPERARVPERHRRVSGATARGRHRARATDRRRSWPFVVRLHTPERLGTLSRLKHLREDRLRFCVAPADKEAAFSSHDPSHRLSFGPGKRALPSAVRRPCPVPRTLCAPAEVRGHFRGRGRIRTCVGYAGDFTDRSLWPLGHPPAHAPSRRSSG